MFNISNAKFKKKNLFRILGAPVILTPTNIYQYYYLHVMKPSNTNQYLKLWKRKKFVTLVVNKPHC